MRVAWIMNWRGFRIGPRAISGRAHLRMVLLENGWTVGVMGRHWPLSNLLWYRHEVDR